MYIKNRLGMVEGTETMIAQEHRMNQISNNLANVDTTGYKKDDITFWEMMFTAADNRERVGKAMRVVTDQGQGTFEATNSPLDFAIEGDGFFKIQTPDGVAYTRNGNFTLNNAGQLSTMEGNLVMGAGGTITLTDDKVQVGRDGAIAANGQIVNQLTLVTFADLKELNKEGNNLFKPKSGNVQEVAVETASIQQGFLESSNVQVVNEMTAMIDLHRAFQSQQKVIQTIDEIDGQAISKVGKLT